MTESYAAQDSDYLTTHRTRTAARNDGPPPTPTPTPTPTPNFSLGSQSSATETAAPAPGPGPAANGPSTQTSAPPVPAPCITSTAESTGTHSATSGTSPPPPADMAITEQPAAVSHGSAPTEVERTQSGLDNRRSESVAHVPRSSSRGGGGGAVGSGAARGIKRRGSDSCIVLMAVGARQGTKRRSIETHSSATGGLPRSGGGSTHTGERGVPARAVPAPAPPPPQQQQQQHSSAAAGACSDASHSANLRTVPRDGAARNDRRARAASISPLARSRAESRRLPVAAAAVGLRQPQSPGRGVQQSPALGMRHSHGRVPIAPSAGGPRPALCALPSVNRYTLRELKIHNILQNPRLRHEVLFEPKLEFRPNSSGQLAEAKQRAAMQYWTAIDCEVRAMAAVPPPASSVATVTMLVVELREILAEMCEDSPKQDLARHAAALRDCVDEQRVRQQLEHGVFDAVALMGFMSDIMRQHAQPARHAAISRLSVYVQRGRLARALRGAFDVLEAIKIDTANAGIEMYREYMRSTAVAFERSHFTIALRRGTIALDDSTDWWRRALDDARAVGRHRQGLDAVFADAARELVLDPSQSVPTLFRMDESRIQTIRREAERLAIVGMVLLAFSQFLRLAARTSGNAKAHGEFALPNGRLDYERLAAECLQLVPEGCGVQWAESLLATGAASADKRASSKTGDVGFGRLVDDLASVAERIFARVLTASESAMLERTILRAARHECPLRGVVEERVNASIREHTTSLAALNGKLTGSDCEAMPASTKEALRRSMLQFLTPGLASLSAKIHSVVAHHWQVYRTFYASVSSSPHRGSSDASSSSSSSDSGSSGSPDNKAATTSSPTSTTSISC